MDGPFLIIIDRENLANRRESSRISVNSCPIRALFEVGKVSTNFAAAKNGKVGSNFSAAKNSQVSSNSKKR